MKLGAQTVLEREIQTLRACGVHEITIITGRRAEDIRAGGCGTGNLFHPQSGVCGNENV